jgi:hypothetical protein
MSATTMIDGERQTQLLAWGTAPIENYEHWNWFAGYQLRQGRARDYKEQKREEQEGDGGEEQKGDGGEGRNKGDGEEGKNPRPPPISRALAIFTDRKKGLAKAIKNHFPSCFHFFSILFHIKKNIIVVKYGLKETTNKMLWKAAKALLVGDFDIWVNKRIEEVADSRIHKYLQKIPPAQSATSYYAPICK